MAFSIFCALLVLLVATAEGSLSPELSALPPSHDLSLAQDIVLADVSNGNTCPEGYSKITSAEHCRAVMNFLGEEGEFMGKEHSSEWPAGCYYCDNVRGCSDGTWYNSHPTGAKNRNARAYCGKNSDIIPGKILLIGDSDINLWLNTHSVFSGSYNVGNSGDTCLNVLQETDKMIATFQPSWVILVCGENDIAEGQKLTTTFGRFKNIVQKYISAGVRVLYMSTKPEPSTLSLHEKYKIYDNSIKQEAARLASEYSEPPFLQVVDSYNGFLDVCNPFNLYIDDRMHLSSDGYALWNQWATTAMGNSESSIANCQVYQSDACVQGPTVSQPPVTECMDANTKRCQKTSMRKGKSLWKACRAHSTRNTCKESCCTGCPESETCKDKSGSQSKVCKKAKRRPNMCDRTNIAAKCAKTCGVCSVDE